VTVLDLDVHQLMSWLTGSGSTPPAVRAHGTATQAAALRATNLISAPSRG